MVCARTPPEARRIARPKEEFVSLWGMPVLQDKWFFLLINSRNFTHRTFQKNHLQQIRLHISNAHKAYDSRQYLCNTRLLLSMAGYSETWGPVSWIRWLTSEKSSGPGVYLHERPPEPPKPAIQMVAHTSDCTYSSSRAHLPLLISQIASPFALNPFA